VTETRWQVSTLPRQDEIEYRLFLTTPTDDPQVVAAIEDAAARAGMAIVRVEEDE